MAAPAHALDRAPVLDDPLVAAAPRFELPALLRVLRQRGYGPEAILFESARTAPTRPGLVSSLRFEGPPRRVVVRLSAGLLGPDGPLPSYFARFANELDDPRPFLAFIRFFDHVLAASAAYVGCPAEGVALGSPLPAAYQAIAAARSPARLHALLRAIVPELPVEVFAAGLERTEPIAAARLGGARLDGTALMGFQRRTRVAGFVARLHAEAETDDGGRPWVELVRERCGRRLLPLLRRGARAVSVRLAFGAYAGRARLGRPAQLGVEPITDGGERGWEVEVLRVGPRGCA